VPLTASEVKTGLYLYGITSADSAAEPIETPGVEYGEVECVVEDGLAAMVTRLTEEKVRPRRANLAAHLHVLRDLAARHASVLPVAFGTIAGGESHLREVLRENYDVLMEHLTRLGGKVEMGLSVYWETSNVFEFFVATHRELQEMRDRLFAPGRTPTFEEKVQIGKRFESLLRKSRERHTEQVVATLAPYCVDIRSIDPGDEKAVMKLACLVEEHRRDAWEDGVELAATHFDNHYRFRCAGPWAPHSFADLNLALDTAH